MKKEVRHGAHAMKKAVLLCYQRAVYALFYNCCALVS